MKNSMLCGRYLQKQQHIKGVTLAVTPFAFIYFIKTLGRCPNTPLACLRPWGVAPTPHKPLKRLVRNFSKKLLWALPTPVNL